MSFRAAFDLVPASPLSFKEQSVGQRRVAPPRLDPLRRGPFDVVAASQEADLDAEGRQHGRSRRPASSGVPPARWRTGGGPWGLVALPTSFVASASGRLLAGHLLFQNQ